MAASFSRLSKPVIRAKAPTLAEFPFPALQEALMSFRSRNVQFSASSRKSAALRGGILLYATKVIQETCHVFSMISDDLSR
ncbi:MAG: hypothetical protein WBM78_22180, partial [Desulfobacterales bacterium]